VHTYDITKTVSAKKGGTREFAEAVVKRLGQTPQILKSVKYQNVPSQAGATKAVVSERVRSKKELVGVDVFLDWDKGSQ